ncbi:MAG: 50S ribosomal protein L25/general stress protein Ctc [Hyphomonas sp.]|uniref:50S ribosomal protein L25/general stress protein Ctc n=1 Tax=Hyphomonas sp. TaxID=87 RepID=UPI0017BA049A|nr:50S ribosomal protein L25/general stress protein Ctc [Hyphomonas sp.]MBA3070408.1 50S ribosomal protein L25/general stress protein Ctc [Hyphomonas sp.]MBU4061721.1 50S ribosomal protein L25/general stress protein Ctc [Alphaproteobacteria bacterium]MBU4164529.1 50S ribosomal protein L25/general stress protein Ctc [Alphaproteobacteria bacterium]
MSKHKIEFNVEVRPRTGTGGAREARRQGFVPGVLYGGDLAPVAINLRKPEVKKAIETGQFLNTTATLIHKGEKQLVIPQGIQMHPVTDQPWHVDLFRVEKDQIIKVEVPVHFKGLEACPGIKKGGTLNVVRHTVEINVPAGHIPEHLEADISALEVGDNVKISNVKLPKDASPVIGDRDFTIATIAGRGGKTEEEPAAAAAADAVPAAKAAAPKAGAAAAAPAKAAPAKPAPKK